MVSFVSVEFAFINHLLLPKLDQIQIEFPHRIQVLLRQQLKFWAKVGE
jgi:uncharacterized membrane protein